MRKDAKSAKVERRQSSVIPHFHAMNFTAARDWYNTVMARPLDYRNPKNRDDPPEPAPRPALPRPPRVAVPLEFDARLTQTKDHAAAQAIEVALTKAGIAFFRTDDATAADRQ